MIASVIGMLDLQPHVHLEEIELRGVAVALHEELDGAGVDVAGRACCGERGARQTRRGSPASAPGAGASSMTF